MAIQSFMKLPNDCDALSELASCYECIGDREEAISVLESLLVLKDSQEVRLQIASLFEQIRSQVHQQQKEEMEMLDQMKVDYGDDDDGYEQSEYEDFVGESE